jgi:hypothetical protein
MLRCGRDDLLFVLQSVGGQPRRCERGSFCGSLEFNKLGAVGDLIARGHTKADDLARSRGAVSVDVERVDERERPREPSIEDSGTTTTTTSCSLSCKRSASFRSALPLSRQPSSARHGESRSAAAANFALPHAARGRATRRDRKLMLFETPTTLY